MASNNLMARYKRSHDFDTAGWHGLTPGASYRVEGISNREGTPWFSITNDHGRTSMYSSLIFDPIYLQEEKTL